MRWKKLTCFVVSPKTHFRIKNETGYFYHTKRRRWKLPLKTDIHAPDNIGYAFFRGKYIGYFYV